MRYVVKVDDLGLPHHALPQVSRQLTNPYAESSGAGGERLWIVTIDAAVLPITHSVNSVGQLLRYASRAVLSVNQLARKGFTVTLASRQIIIIVVERDMKTAVVGRDARNVVEGIVKPRGPAQVLLPRWIGAGLDGAEEIGANRAGILRL